MDVEDRFLLIGLKQELAKHRWIPVAEGLPERITKEQRKNSKYPLVFITQVHIGNSTNTAFLNENGYFQSIGGETYDHESETGKVTHWKPIILPLATEGQLCKK